MEDRPRHLGLSVFVLGCEIPGGAAAADDEIHRRLYGKGGGEGGGEAGEEARVLVPRWIIFHLYTTTNWYDYTYIV